MKNIYLITLCLLFPLIAHADEIENRLNKVTLQLKAEQWVTTKTALVDVGINASVTDHGIEKLQNEVLQKLNELSNKGEWHIVSFVREQDKSGLESIQMSAQARLPQDGLAQLRDKAKNISNPGETYTIDNVQFIPSDDEIMQANSALRENIYQQAKGEVDVLNKIYLDQKYNVHSIDFTPRVIMPVAQNEMMYAGKNLANAPVSVGNKQEVQAVVVLSSVTQPMQKLSKL